MSVTTTYTTINNVNFSNICIENNTDYLRWILKKGYRPTLENVEFVSLHGTSTMVELLLLFINLTNPVTELYTSLQNACKTGNIKKVHVLLLSGGSINYKKFTFSMSLLELALRYSHKELAQYFIDNGAIIDGGCLEYAAQNNLEEFVIYFIENKKCKNSIVIALLDAYLYKHSKIVKYLLNICLQDDYLKKTLYEQAEEEPCCENFIKEYLTV